MTIVDTSATRWSHIRASYREPFRSTLRHPASWLFAALCLACAGYLAALGEWGFLGLAAGTAAGTAIFVLLTLPLTTPVPDAPWPGPTSDATAKTRGRLWAQVGVLTLLALLIYHWTLNGNVVLPLGLRSIPLWTPFLDWTFHSVDFLLGSRMPAEFPLNDVAPVIMLLVPGVALLLLGARPGELGFARGYRSLRVAAVWCVGPLAIVVIDLVIGLAMGKVPAAVLFANLGWRTLQTTFNSGPFEEFFFRGALMTRLARLLGDGWGIVLSGIAFGLLHIGTETAHDARGNLLAGAALALLLQGIGGVGFAIVVRRTRNLLASSIIHVISNVAFG
jgi:membrane protease YdiL (CAAX protease family)